MNADDATRLFRSLSDPLRLRLLALLRREELSVSDLVAVLGAGQSTVSGHLARLGEAGLTTSRREGRFLLHRCCAEAPDRELSEPLLAAFEAMPEAAADRARLESMRAEQRQGPPPSTLGRGYLPGRTWEGLGRALLASSELGRVADIGVGSAELSALLARSSEHLVGIATSTAEAGHAARLLEQAGCAGRSELRIGSLEAPPLDAASCERVFASQVLQKAADPAALCKAAARALVPGGRFIAITLAPHGEDWVRDRLAHRTLGFSPGQLHALMRGAGFVDTRVERAARDRKAPHFESLFVTGRTAS